MSPLLALAIIQAAPAGLTMVDRFVAAFPADRRPELAAIGNDQAEIEWLIGLNPTRAAELRAIGDTHSACATPLMARMSENGLRWVAGRLGDERLARIVAYYESGDAAFIDRLEAAAARGEMPDAGDQARAEQIFAGYPLREYFEALEATYDEREEPLMADLYACDHARDDAFLQLNLRYSDEEED